MGLLFLIYYCVSIYSAKGDVKEGQSMPLDVGGLAEDTGDAEANGEETAEGNTEGKSVLETTPAFEVSSKGFKSCLSLMNLFLPGRPRRPRNPLLYTSPFLPGVPSGTTARLRPSSSSQSR